MRSIHLYLALAILFVAFGCGPSAKMRTVNAKAQKLVDRRATTNEVAVAFGAPPLHIYKREEALQYLQHTPRSDRSVLNTWQQMSRYPQTHAFETPAGEIYIYFDDEGRAAGYHSNIQF